ncbi:AraC family transcriptional regulator [Paenibacillus flagellatus]|uniref:AraC family transcriptional regulator n=1 Tax=Paenibacillus flagellatus TaxID=2211139 RepID=A0A2V5L3F0_9BACL|nr:AraC family transcriptional regulator [Paenibacillus flagellatus]PYI57346.1 AraC family transcriptional regulator [Paenibacillus flagellatus]
MYFKQLLAAIPLFERIELRRDSGTVDCPANVYALIAVRSGHITIAPPDREPVVCVQGYACHPDFGPYTIQIPKTKQAEYAVVYYRMAAECGDWTLTGPLATMSEVKIRYMLDELIRTTEDDHSGSEDEQAARQFRMRMMLERMLYIFLYESRMRQADKSSVESIGETLSYMNEHYMLKLTLPMMARRAGMSEGHYTVLFKKLTGTTMTAYLRRLRIEKAMEIFRQTALPAKEIAQTVGFSDYFHFSRVFKQETGRSPSEFQKSLSEI